MRVEVACPNRMDPPTSRPEFGMALTLQVLYE